MSILCSRFLSRVTAENDFLHSLLGKVTAFKGDSGGQGRHCASLRRGAGLTVARGPLILHQTDQTSEPRESQPSLQTDHCKEWERGLSRHGRHVS